MNLNTTLDVEVYKDHKDHGEWKELSKSRQRVDNCRVVWVGITDLLTVMNYSRGCQQAHIWDIQAVSMHLQKPRKEPPHFLIVKAEK